MDPVHHPVAAQVRVEAVERAARPQMWIVHRPCPETPLPIGLTVVEAVLGLIGLRVDDGFETAAGGIEEVEAACHRHHQAALRADRQATQVLRRIPPRGGAARRIGAMDQAALDIHPPQYLLTRIP